MSKTLEQQLAHALIQHHDAVMNCDVVRIEELDDVIHAITWRMDHETVIPMDERTTERPLITERGVS